MTQPIVDAHQHFWDLDRNYLPWLCDQPPIPFRYGDYGALRRNYLPADYRRDSRRHDVVPLAILWICIGLQRRIDHDKSGVRVTIAERVFEHRDSKSGEHQAPLPCPEIQARPPVDH